METQDQSNELHYTAATLHEAHEHLRERHQRAAAELEQARTPDMATNYVAQERYRRVKQELILASVLLRELREDNPWLYEAQPPEAQ